jgi:hypothetical protein
LDGGALTPSLWGFEEREKLMGFNRVPTKPDSRRSKRRDAGGHAQTTRDFSERTHALWLGIGSIREQDGYRGIF